MQLSEKHGVGRVSIITSVHISFATSKTELEIFGNKPYI